MSIPADEQISQPEPQNLSEWLPWLNQQIGEAAAAYAEEAFGMGCLTSVVPIGIGLLLAYLFGARHWVSLMLVGLVFIFLGIVWAVYLALKAHRAGLRKAWHDRFIQEFERGLSEHNLVLDAVLSQVEALLPEQAPLRRGLAGALEPLESQSQDEDSNDLGVNHE